MRALRCTDSLGRGCSSLRMSSVWRMSSACAAFDSSASALSRSNTRVSSSNAVYRLDLVVENTIIVEIKSVEHLLPIHTAQLLTYLRLTRLPIGLLFNFHEAVLKQGLRRLVISPAFPSSRLPVDPFD